jgi:hypothetical protein
MIPTDLSPFANHLWQSTLCVAAVWLMAFQLRPNRAAIRYWLWLAASLPPRFTLWSRQFSGSFQWCSGSVYVLWKSASGRATKSEFYLQSNNRIVTGLNCCRRLMLAMVAFMAVTGPLGVGMMTVSRALRAQSTAAFEVASVKPHAKEDRSGSIPQFLAGGRFKTAGVPLQFVIAYAYNLPFQGPQLSGGPDWIRSPEGIYDIEARADEASLRGLPPEAREEKMRLMLQTLLAELKNSRCTY